MPQQTTEVRAWFESHGWQLEPDLLRAALKERGISGDPLIELVEEGAARRVAAAADAARQPERTNGNGGHGQPSPEQAAPPMNLEAEESVLGAMMIAPAAIATCREILLTGREFYRESHSKIWRAALELADEGKPVDAITLTDRLEQRGDLEDVGGRVRLYELARLVPATANVAHYARIVAETAQLRDLIRAGGEIARLGWERPGDTNDLLERAREISEQATRHTARQPITITWAPTFIAQQTETVQTLLGAGDDKLLPAHGFALVYGKGGQGKTTLTLTAVAALASATAWLGIPVPRPARVCMIENEGPKAPYIEKLNRFADQWDGPDFLANVALYEEPWGQYSLADRGMREDLLAFCRDQQIDVVAAGPLRGLGIEGPGAPTETDAFLNLLKEAGLGTELAWWIVHHTNKQNQISGDWDRQPDLLLRLTYEGKRRNRLTFEKVRWGDQGREPLTLEWLDEAVGYRIIATTTDEIDWLDVEHRVLAAVEQNPRCSQRKVEDLAGGKATHVRETVRRLLDQGRLTDLGKGGKKVLTIPANAPATLPADPEELEWT